VNFEKISRNSIEEMHSFLTFYICKFEVAFRLQIFKFLSLHSIEDFERANDAELYAADVCIYLCILHICLDIAMKSALRLIHI